MKVGDLVQLSAYGRKLKCYNYYPKILNGFGIVVERFAVTILVKFQGVGTINFYRRELKYFSKVK